jgi:hypothetical protein
MSFPGSASSMKEKRPHGYNIARTQQFTPEQIELFQQLFSHLGPDSFLSRLAGGDEEQFAEMEAPALRQFSQLQGNLASRFSGMGSGARNSSGFQNASNAAASDFASGLQSQRLALQQQALKDLMGLSNTLLNQRPFETSLVQKPEKSSPWSQLAGSLFGGFAGSAGGPAGKAFGNAVGNQFASLF